MVSLPTELEYHIISFNPNLSGVCKGWEEEIKVIRFNAIQKISNWYYKRLCKKDSVERDVRDWIRKMIVHYPEEYFLGYPEWIVNMLALNNTLLDILPSKVSRKKSHVRDWMMNMPLTLNDWHYYTRWW